MKILLTGSAGFIGQSLKLFFKKNGTETVSYDIGDTPSNNILDFQNLKTKLSGVDGVVHLAAMSQPKFTHKDPRGCAEMNVMGTANVLEAARISQKHPWVIFISSREVFGNAKTLPITEKTPRRSISLYGATKVAGEDLCRIFSENYGLKTRILRFTSVYSGKNDRLDRVIPRFIIQAAKNEPLIIQGTGNELFDFTYVSDIASGIWKCIQEIEKSKKLHDDFILSLGKPVSLRDLAKIIIEETKSHSEIRYRKNPNFSTAKCYADCKKAKRILGFEPKVNIREGIKLAIKEFREANII